MTLEQLIATQAQRLTQAGVSFGHGTTNAHDEAAWLVLWRLGLPLDTDTATLGSTHVDAADQEAVVALVGTRILSRQPAAYLTGEAWLQGVPFDIDPRAIVPRSLIAEPLADGRIDAWLTEQTHEVLDLCTGNGSLAVLAAMAWPEVRVTGADLSPEALAVAQRNVQRHGLGARIDLRLSDGLQACPGPWDLVLCNPPYVNAQTMATLPAEHRAEPALALDGGPDGMNFVRTLLHDLPTRLSPEGVLVLEIGHERPNFERAFPGLEPVWLDTSGGPDGVLVLTADDLRTWKACP